MRSLIAALVWGVAALLFYTETHAQTRYTPAVHGQVAAFRLAGVEPDGDPLDQVALQTTLTPSAGIPALHLIVSAYLENFKPDTTPILPDLLHPHRTAHNLGGFLQGKALLTDDAGEVLFIGSFLNEAFLDNSNHAVMQFFNSTTTSPRGALSGTFGLSRSGALTGNFSGRLTLSGAARKQIAQHRGARLKPIAKILRVVQVRPAPMMGRNTNGSPGAPLKTGFGHPTPAPLRSPSPPLATTTSAAHLSPWTIAAGIGALVSLIIGVVLFLTSRPNRHSSGT